MNFYARFIGLIILAAAMSFTACGAGGEAASVSFDSPDSPGDVVSLRVAAETSNMVYANNSLTAIVFPMAQNDASTGSISERFFIGETEVTYGVWKKIYDWATTDAGGGIRADGGELYHFINAGREGNDGVIGSAATVAKKEPVTTVSWRDVIVWCNALTEWYNAQKGTSYACVYTSDAGFTAPIRDLSSGVYGTVDTTAGSIDNPYVNPDAKGFRLPTSMEWEYAARYLGTSAPSTDDGLDDEYVSSGHNDTSITGLLTPGYYWLPYNYVIGATDDFSFDDCTDVAWYSFNANNSTHAVRQLDANYLGLYDMSGNVAEWCIDAQVSDYSRYVHNSFWGDSEAHILVFYGNFDPPYMAFNSIGFRIAKSQ